MYELSDSEIDIIEKKIGYRFRDKRLLTQAFVRQSYLNENHGSTYSNEILEFIGDAVLSLSVVDMMTKDCPVTNRGLRVSADEGELTRLRSRLTDKRYLSSAERRLDLARYLVMSVGDVRNDVHTTRSVREDLIESIIGAVYIDTGRDMARTQAFVDGLLDINIKVDTTPTTRDDKTRLQEYLQCIHKPLPIYELVSKVGPDNSPTFTVNCVIEGEVYGTATARSKKDAEKSSARQAYERLTEGEGDVGE